MNWYLTLKFAATQHCLGRIDKRLAPYAAELHDSVSIAEEIYKQYNNSFAVCIKELPQTIQINKKNDMSNGDWVVAIIRPVGETSECKTVMLRRSPNHPTAPQPFTSQALGVDYPITLQQFKSDQLAYKPQAGALESNQV